MTTQEVQVENIKCSGCMNSIKSALLKMNGVVDVRIVQEKGKVCITGIAVERAAIVDKLASLGYPEKGNNDLMNKARSFISCAVGKITS